MSKNRKHKSSSIKSTILQLIQPKPIPAGPSLYRNEPSELQQDWEELIPMLRKRNPDADKLLAQHRHVVNQYERVLQKQMGLIANICTGLWRIKQNFSQIPSEEMPDKVRRSNRHLDSIMDALNQNGVLIQDHLRELYDPGMSLNVAAYEPTDGITHETVIETIKPSVYWEDKCIQNGEVIIGTPKNQDEMSEPKRSWYEKHD